MVDFSVSSSTTQAELQATLNQYNGTVESCTTNDDGSKKCRVSFPDSNKADSAMAAAKQGSLPGVTGAAAEAPPSAPNSPTSGGGNVGLIVGIVVGVVVVVGVVAAVVWKIRAGGHAPSEDEDYSNMNMALEDMNQNFDDV